MQAQIDPDLDVRHSGACIVFGVVRKVWKTYKHGIKRVKRKQKTTRRASNRAPRHLLLGRTLLPPDVTLLSDGKLGTLALGQRNPWLGALPNNENVRYPKVWRFNMMLHAGKHEVKNSPRCESTVQSILHVHDVEVSDVLLTVHNDTRTTHVATAGDHDDVAGVKLGIVGDLVLGEVKLHSVVDLDQGVRVTDGAAVVSYDVRNTLGTDGDLLDLQELVFGLLGGDTVDGETALDVVKETEVLA